MLTVVALHSYYGQAHILADISLEVNAEIGRAHV